MSKKQKNARDKTYKELKEHFRGWKRRWNKSYHVKFAEDGILPWAGYSKYWPKILFIGREPYKCTGGLLLEDYYKGNFTRPAYHLLDKVAYGLINKKEWKDLPKRDDIPRPPDGFSFAFVNVSKYANPEGPRLSKNFENYARGNLDFTRKEIDLLNPDLIISWNIRGAFKKDKNGNKDNGDCFLRELTGSNSPEKGSPKNVRIWTYKGKREIPLLDTYAFYARVEHRNHIYDPIMKAVNSKAVKDLIAKKKLNDLFEDWKEAVSFGDKFVEDGALPGYLSQDPKILFIGRESYDCKGDDLMWGIQHGFFKEDGSEDSNNLFICAWKVAHGLLNGIEKWDDIPEIEKIRRKGTSTSFAFMDVSKFENNEGPSLSPKFKKYVYESMGENKSGRNFIREEIDLLNPDLIISWNLIQCRGLGKTFLKKLTGSDSCEERSNVHIWVYKSKIPLLDTWHFSAVTKRKEKDPETEVYNPIWKAANSKAVKDLIAKKKAQDKAELR